MTAESLLPGVVFDEERAARPIQCIERLKHFKGFSGYIKLAPWQKEAFSRLFGTLRPSSLDPTKMVRLYRDFYLEVPRKNGKSTSMSGLGIYMAFCDGEKGADVICIANSNDQVKAIWETAVYMVESNPVLRKRIKIRPTCRELVSKKDGSKFSAKSAIDKDKDGLNNSCIIVDELHAFKNRELWGKLRTGSASRQQPLFISITTAGGDREGICWEQHRMTEITAKDPSKNPYFLGYIYGKPPELAWDTLEAYQAANPSFGYSLTRDAWDTTISAARLSKGEEQQFKRYYLNMWGEEATDWINLDDWYACTHPVTDEEREAMETSSCLIGLDLSQTRDLTSVALYFPYLKRVFTHSFIPAETAKDAEIKESRPFSQWAADGWVTITPGRAVDYDRVREYITGLAERYRGFLGVGFDRWNAQDMISKLEARGLTCFSVAQNAGRLNLASKAFEVDVVNRDIKHNGDPLLRMAIKDVRLKVDHNGNYFPRRDKASGGRIDPLMAFLTAKALFLDLEGQLSPYARK